MARRSDNNNLVKGLCLRDEYMKCYFSSESREPQPLASHGTAILAISKVIFMKATRFLLSYLAPNKAQLLYIDTGDLLDSYVLMIIFLKILNTGL